MTTDFLKQTGRLALLVLLQALVLNRIHVLGYATPFFYVYFLLTLHHNCSRNGLLVWGFFAGLAIDIFSDTPGMNVLAAVFLAFVRPLLLTLFAPHDIPEDVRPGIRTMGLWPFFRYVLVGAMLHHAVLLTVESFSFLYPLPLLVSILSSALLTTCCIMAWEGMTQT